MFSYVVASDTGFAPNPFHGFLTLACCKPLIRRQGSVGDIVVGLSSRSARVVYAARVEHVISFEEFWADPRYESRRPVPTSARVVDRTGDNIYEPLDGAFRQLHSAHSHADGTENSSSKQHDLGGQQVLVCDRFAYWGGTGPSLPEEVGFLAVGRGHRSRFSDDQIAAVARWFSNQPQGVLGPPTRWKVGDESWRQA
ncbi:hypothetical protein IMY96_01740 [Pimelobacter simplex]|nr:hypothetical protein [Pimelobacter simplex]